MLPVWCWACKLWFKSRSLQNTEGMLLLCAGSIPSRVIRTMWLSNTPRGNIKVIVMVRRGVSTYMITTLKKNTTVVVRKKSVSFFVLFYQLSSTSFLGCANCPTQHTPQCSDRTLLRGRSSLPSRETEGLSQFFSKYQFLQLSFQQYWCFILNRLKSFIKIKVNVA